MSAYHKDGLAAFARGLAELGVRILSSGGSAEALRRAGLTVEEISEYTGWPEMLGGRVKTLHPKIHAGILARRDRPEQLAELAAGGIAPIDLVAVDPYPFEEIAGRAADLSEAVEGIDVGGPAMLRAAAKNHEFVAAVAGREAYADVLRVLGAQAGSTDLASRRRWASAAFDFLSRYDARVAERLGGGGENGFPDRLRPGARLALTFRYGENPHQRGALYREEEAGGTAVGSAQLQGKALSFNNLADLDAALRLVGVFEEPAAAIVKHMSPCGVAAGDRLLDAFVRARKTDEKSAFGGVVAFNRPLDGETASSIVEFFVEAVIATGVTEEAKAILAKRKNLILLDAGELRRRPPSTLELRSVWGGIVAQEWDPGTFSWDRVRVVTRRAPAPEEVRRMTFAWKVVRFVRSNAIVLAEERATVGIGAGQMSRVDSVELAVWKARAAGIDTAGAALASDGFFPFPDSLEVAHRAGVTAVIEPGGSVRDPAVIEKANELGMAMAFTGTRHFKH